MDAPSATEGRLIHRREWRSPVERTAAPRAALGDDRFAVTQQRICGARQDRLDTLHAPVQSYRRNENAPTVDVTAGVFCVLGYFCAATRCVNA